MLYDVNNVLNMISTELQLETLRSLKIQYNVRPQGSQSRSIMANYWHDLICCNDIVKDLKPVCILFVLQHILSVLCLSDGFESKLQGLTPSVIFPIRSLLVCQLDEPHTYHC